MNKVLDILGFTAMIGIGAVVVTISVWQSIVIGVALIQWVVGLF